MLGLNSTQTAQASLGLKDICRECQVHLKPFAEPLLQACLQAITNNHIINSDEVRLMYSIGKLMSMLSPEDVLRWLDIVVSPCFSELQCLVQSQTVSNVQSHHFSNNLQIVILSLFIFFLGEWSKSCSSNFPFEYDFNAIFIIEYEN